MGYAIKAPSLDPSSYKILTDDGHLEGTFANHINEISGCGETNVLPQLQRNIEYRFGALKIQEKIFAHVRLKLTQRPSFSVTATQ